MLPDFLSLSGQVGLSVVSSLGKAETVLMLFVSFGGSHALSGILQICVSYFILVSMKTKYNFTYVHELFPSRLLFQF